MIAREKYFQPEGPRELHAWDNPTEIRANVGRDALIEMFLLARGDALVCYPPNSFFSFYARTCAGGPKVQVKEEAFRPQIPDRSPAPLPPASVRPTGGG